MADKKISQFNPVTSFDPGDYLPLIRPGDPLDQNKKLPQDVLTELVMDTIANALTKGSNIDITYDDGGNKIIISSTATGSGGTVSIPKSHPGYGSGRWYRPGPYSQSNSADTANNIKAIPLVIREAVTISDLGIYVVTGAAGMSQRLAIFSHNDATKQPGTKLREVTVSVASSAATASAVLSTPITLEPGIYWVVSQAEGTPTLVQTATTDGTISSLLGTANSNPTRIEQALQASAPYSSGIPDTWPGGATAQVGCPLICFKVA